MRYEILSQYSNNERLTLKHLGVCSPKNKSVQISNSFYKKNYKHFFYSQESRPLGPGVTDTCITLHSDLLEIMKRAFQCFLKYNVLNK